MGVANELHYEPWMDLGIIIWVVFVRIDVHFEHILLLKRAGPIFLGVEMH